MSGAINQIIMQHGFTLHSLFILVAIFLTCNNSYQITDDKNIATDCNQLKPGEKGFIQLANGKEPGEPLIIYGKIIDRSTRAPIKDGTLFLYQTDSSGIYSTTGSDEQARIRGTVKTNANGCFKIKTILPGDYPNRKNSRHLHYVINVEGYEELKSILFFKGFTTENITGDGPLKVLDIKKDKTGTWIGETELTLVRIKKQKSN